MSDDDFSEEDETPEEIDAAIRHGERGTTRGPKDLNARAAGIVRAAVARYEQEPVAPSTAWDFDSVVIKDSELVGVAGGIRVA